MSAWRIVIPPARLPEFQADAAFAELLVLARIANALRFALWAGFKVEEGAVGHRQRNAAFLQTAASVSETLVTLKRMGLHFRHLPAYREFVQPILDDDDARDLRGKVLKWLRDKAVFHHDKIVTPIGLKGLDRGTWTFAEGDTQNFMDVAYPLADFAIIRAALEQIGPADNLVDAFESVLSRTIEIAKSIVIAVDTLIGQALDERGLVFDETA